MGITYLIGKTIKNGIVGHVASLFLAFCYESVVKSHYCTVDTTLTFFFILAVYQCLLLFHKDNLGRYICAGFLIGITTAVKFNGIVAAVAFVSVLFLKEGNSNLLKKVLSQKLWLGMASIFLGHFLACPYFYIDFNIALSEIVQLKILHSFSGFKLWIYTRELMKNYWGVPLGALCVGGLIRSIIPVNRKILVVFLTALVVLCFEVVPRANIPAALAKESAMPVARIPAMRIWQLLSKERVIVTPMSVMTASMTPNVTPCASLTFIFIYLGILFEIKGSDSILGFSI